MTIATVIMMAAWGCAHHDFPSDDEFSTAVHDSREVIERLNRMPINDLGKLAFSKKLRQEWKDKENEVFAGTRFLFAKIRHNPPAYPSNSHRLSPLQGTLTSMGRGRPALGGYLGQGKAKTARYTGPTYVYLLKDGWSELWVHIAAGELPD